MNDLIKKCAQEVGFKVDWQHDDVRAIKMARYEKFAELIVRECADYVQFYYKDHMCEVIAHDMKTHFGVK